MKKNLKKKKVLGQANEKKTKEIVDKSNTKRKAQTPTNRLEVALKYVKEGFINSCENAEDEFVDLEQRKFDLETKKLDIDRPRRESEERIKSKESQNQFQMIKMIMGADGQTAVPPPYFPDGDFGGRLSVRPTVFSLPWIVLPAVTRFGRIR